jgi:tetratricopeptide (TPR) repeat protein
MIRLDALPRLSARHSRAARVFRVLAGVLIGLFAAEGVFRLYLSLRNNAVEAESFEIFAVGGSTTLGQPYEDKISFPKITRFLLGERVGSRAIVVHNLAEKGHRIASQRALFDLRVAHRNRNRPGAVLIYSGHNDAVVYSDPGLHKVRAYTLLDETLTRTSLLFLQMASYWRDRGFLTAPAEPEDAVPTREEMFHAYEFNLRRVIESARERGLYPILSTVIGNVADFDPGLPPETDPAVLDAIRKGLAMESEGRYGEALRRYRRIFSETSPPADNYARYRIAKCLEALGRREEARLAYWAVVESGGDFHRATRLQNDLIRRLAAEYRVPLVDAVGAFEGTSPGKIPDTSCWDVFLRRNYRKRSAGTDPAASRERAQFGIFSKSTIRSLPMFTWPPLESMRAPRSATPSPRNALSGPGITSLPPGGWIRPTAKPTDWPAFSTRCAPLPAVSGPSGRNCFPPTSNAGYCSRRILPS